MRTMSKHTFIPEGFFFVGAISPINSSVCRYTQRYRLPKKKKKKKEEEASERSSSASAVVYSEVILSDE